MAIENPDTFAESVALRAHMVDMDVCGAGGLLRLYSPSHLRPDGLADMRLQRAAETLRNVAAQIETYRNSARAKHNEAA